MKENNKTFDIYCTRYNQMIGMNEAADIVVREQLVSRGNFVSLIIS